MEECKNCINRIFVRHIEEHLEKLVPPDVATPFVKCKICDKDIGEIFDEYMKAGEK